MSAYNIAIISFLVYNSIMNHNQILGVSANAPKEEIQQAFRKAALETHPDHSNSPEAAEAFARIKEARDELMKRADASGEHDTVQHSTAAAVNATSNAAYATSTDDSLFDGFTPEEVVYIQKLDRMAAQKPKRSLFHRVKESAEVRRHRNKINTVNKRINGEY